MSLLTPDLGLLFWMLLSFLIVFGALAKFGFPIITGMVDKRRQHISEALRAADEARARLDGVEEEARKMMEEATKRSSEIMATAVSDSQRIVTAAHERAEAESAARVEAARRQIEIEKEKALGQMRSEVAMLSVDIAEKVMRTHLDSEAGERELIARLLDEAQNNTNAPAKEGER
ncbi:MAG: F0F1 ATP synthase subunit B [Tidjanibacter sp.]|nr:F0F1 ATP synthase subunit B [Tidjanibacter sp.]